MVGKERIEANEEFVCRLIKDDTGEVLSEQVHTNVRKTDKVLLKRRVCHPNGKEEEIEFDENGNEINRRVLKEGN